jgi:type II secretory pathway pseudopilin PulG
MRRDIEQRKAFTLLELIVILVILAVLMALLLPVMAGARAKANRIKCSGRLGCVGLAYRIFATDHGDRFPWEVSTNQAKSLDWFVEQTRSLSNQLSTPVILVCPADTRKPATDWASLTRTNMSYFVSVASSQSYPQSILAGDRNVTTNGVRIGPGIVNVQTNFGWDGTMHRFQGMCVMGDGSVQQMSSARLRQASQNTGQSSETWAVP